MVGVPCSERMPCYRRTLITRITSFGCLSFPVDGWAAKSIKQRLGRRVEGLGGKHPAGRPCSGRSEVLLRVDFSLLRPGMDTPAWMGGSIPMPLNTEALRVSWCKVGFYRQIGSARRAELEAGWI